MESVTSHDASAIPSLAARVLMKLVRFYQLAVSPWFGRVCRFEPSCSRYAMSCLEMHGAVRGSLLSVRRLSKCHPFHAGGHDPPPPATDRPNRDRETADR